MFCEIKIISSRNDSFSSLRYILCNSLELCFDSCQKYERRHISVFRVATSYRYSPVADLALIARL